MSSPIEVEFKFPVDDLAKLRASLVAMGAQPVKISNQVDEYINDPLRDFAKLDIALRIRQSDSKMWLTFKGPNLDPTAKIRTEIETPLVDQAAAEQIKQTFIEIGFLLGRSRGQAARNSVAGLGRPTCGDLFGYGRRSR